MVAWAVTSSPVLLSDCGIENAHRIAESPCAAVENFRFVREERSFSVSASVGLVALGDHVLTTSTMRSRRRIKPVTRQAAGTQPWSWKHRAEHIQGNGAMPAPTQDDSVEEMIGGGRPQPRRATDTAGGRSPATVARSPLRIDGEPAGLAAILHDARGPEAGGLKLDTWVLERTAEALGRMHAQYPACRHMEGEPNVGGTVCSPPASIASRSKLAIALYQISPGS